MKLFTVLFSAFWLYIFYQVFVSAMYTYHVIEFYELDYELSKHGLIINGKASQHGNLISVDVLAARLRTEDGIGQHYTCDHVTSKRGHTTMSSVDDELVCCWTASEQQYFVPFKDVNGERHYLCGAWPHLDYVSHSLPETEGPSVTTY